VTRRLARVTIAAAVALLMTAAAAGATYHVVQRASLIDVEDALMCTTCHEPLIAVQSPEALEEKAIVKRLIAQGDTKQQILKAMVAQYGPAVLALPPASGFDLTIYVLPPAIVVAGALFLIFALPKWRARARAQADDSGGGDHKPLSTSDTLRINEELERLI
jgi:cytochrome c-type biogenesis protein CcmH